MIFHVIIELSDTNNYVQSEVLGRTSKLLLVSFDLST